jgi:hypothetical protein
VYPGEFFNQPDMLPYSEPVMPLFGGSGPSGDQDVALEITSNFSETGFCSVPLIGSYVWVFFEQGNHLYPKHFGACQSGPGWLSEHELQHVFSSNNFRVVIDENMNDPRSSTTSDTYNSECTTISRELAKIDQPVRVKIDIVNTEGIAIDLNIIGDVNIKVVGDVYSEITGNKHETIIGNVFKKIKGNIDIEHEGNININRNGNTNLEQVGKDDSRIEGDQSEILVGDKSSIISGSLDIKITGENTEFIGGNNDMTVGGSNIQNAGGIHAHN